MSWVHILSPFVFPLSQAVLSSPLSLNLDGTPAAAASNIDPASYTFVSLASSRPMLCALRYMMFEPMFIVGVALAAVVLVYCLKRLRLYRYARAAEDARLVAANYIITRLKEAARDSVTAQGKAHARYHQEVTAKKLREDALRQNASDLGWTAGTSTYFIICREINIISVRRLTFPA